MIWLGLGSNLGQKKENIAEAIFLLGTYGIQLVRQSDYYETAPWGVLDQPSFINSVCEILFDDHPEILLNKCLTIENQMGRVRTEKWGPRKIDIDVLEFNGQVYVSNKLILPHPLYTQRDFVLVPMAELVPDFIPTGQRETVSELVQKIKELPH